MRSAVLIGIMLSALGGAFPPVPDGAHPQKRVLVLQEFRRDTPLASEMEDVYRQMLGSVLGSRLDYYSGYLDTARFTDAAYRDSAIPLNLRARYEPLRIDVVIATTTATLELRANGRRRVRRRRGRVPWRHRPDRRRPDHWRGIPAGSTLHPRWTRRGTCFQTGHGWRSSADPRRSIAVTSSWCGNSSRRSAHRPRSRG